MRVLVTGGGGFAGLHLLRELQSRDGGSVLAATGLEAAPAFAPGDELGRVQWYTMDVGSAGSVREVMESCRPDVVYHLAGQASVGRSFEVPLETWDVNATGTLRVMSALRGLDHPPRRLLLVSSAEVYGEVEPGKQPIAEDAPMRPVTPYGASKAAAEIAAFTMGPVAGVEVVVARSFNHIGPGQDERFVLPSIALQLVRIKRGEGKPIVQVGNLDVERDFLDVRDVARGYVELMERGDPDRAYNVCSGRSRSLLTVIQRLIDLSETGARLEFDSSRARPIDIGQLVGDPTAMRDLGWEARATLDETLRDLLAEAESRV